MCWPESKWYFSRFHPWQQGSHKYCLLFKLSQEFFCFLQATFQWKSVKKHAHTATVSCEIVIRIFLITLCHKTTKYKKPTKYKIFSIKKDLSPICQKRKKKKKADRDHERTQYIPLHTRNSWKDLVLPSSPSSEILPNAAFCYSSLNIFLTVLAKREKLNDV